jgi:hypothetical protein
MQRAIAIAAALTVGDRCGAPPPSGAPVDVIRASVTVDGEDPFVGWFVLGDDGAPTLLYSEQSAFDAGPARYEPFEPTWYGWRSATATVRPLWRSAQRTAAPAVSSPWGDAEQVAVPLDSLYTEAPGIAPPAIHEVWGTFQDPPGVRLAWSTLAEAHRAHARGAGDRAELAAALQGALSHPLTAHDHRWQDAIAASVALEDPATTLRLYAFYQPIALCSLDRSPLVMATSYGAACAQAGRVGCALRLAVTAGNFGGLPGTSYWRDVRGDPAQWQPTAFTDVGVHDPALWLGALVHLTGDTLSPSIASITSAIAHHDDPSAALAVFQAVAADPTVDEYNRLLATMVVFRSDPYAVPDDLGHAAEAWLAAAHDDPYITYMIP